MFLLNIILIKPSNFLFKLFNKNDKLKKRKPIIIVKFKDSKNLSYIIKYKSTNARS